MTAAEKRAEAHRLMARAHTLLAEAEAPVQDEEGPVDLNLSYADKWFWKTCRMLLALEEHGGDVDRATWFSFADREGYDHRGLGGFHLAAPHTLVRCVGIRRVLTDLGRERLEEGRQRWPQHFGRPAA